MPFLALAAPIIAATSSVGAPSLVAGAASGAVGVERGANAGRAEGLRAQRHAKWITSQPGLRYARDMARAKQSGEPKPVPYDDPTEAYLRVLSRQGTEREIRASTGRAAAFLTPDAGGRYRLGGSR